MAEVIGTLMTWRKTQPRMIYFIRLLASIMIDDERVSLRNMTYIL